MLPANNTPIIFDRPVTDIRRAVLRRRIRASGPVENLLVELAYGSRPDMLDAIRFAPSRMEVGAHG